MFFAFDSILRESVYYKLFKIGISNKMVTIFRPLHGSNIAVVCFGSFLLEHFQATIGLKQGCVLRTLPLILYINDITDEMVEGVNINQLVVLALTYADFIVFLASSVENIQMKINKLER